jgi:hypothetical protein
MSMYWKCPNCGTVLQKHDPMLEQQIKRGVFVAGSATCGNCRSQFSARDVYGGTYDLESGTQSSDKKWWQFWK